MSLPIRRRPAIRLAALLLATLPAGAQEPAQPAPRLVVLVSPGPLVAEQLDGLAPELQGGLARLWSGAFRYPATEVSNARTELPAGAATLATGLPPRRHGIPGDSFLDRESGVTRFATHDTETTLHAPGGVIRQATPGGDSAELLLAPGLAEHLRAAWPGARRVSIAGDARLAVLLPGRRPDLALWWDRRAGGFTSSSWYCAELPAWVLTWNTGWSAQAGGVIWEPLAPAGLAPAGFGPDERAGETPRPGGARLPFAFPELGESPAAVELQALANVVAASPWIDRFTLQLATEALRELELGADDEPDLLCLGLAGCAASSQLCGPFARETGEVLLAADRELGRFFELLDERVGAGRWVAALAGTGGMLPLPEALSERGVGAQRIPSSRTRRSLAKVREALEARYGSFFGAGLSGAVVTLDAGELERTGADPAEVRRAVRDALVGADDWIAGAYTLEELQGVDGDEDDPWLALYRRAFPPLRAPDVVVRPAPWVLFHARHGTDSGSPYPYDRRTVLSFLAPGVQPGASYERARPEDLLPTLLALLGLDVPEGLDGRALSLRR